MTDINDVKIRDGMGVPIVITESTVIRPKKIKRRKKFRGLRAGVSRLLNNIGEWMLDRLEESFLEEVVEVVDEGEKDQTHYAIMVGKEGYDSFLQAVQVEHKPPCVHHYEIVRHADDEKAKAAYIGRDNVSAETEGFARKTRQSNDEVLGNIRDRLRQQGYEDDYYLNSDNFPDDEDLEEYEEEIPFDGEVDELAEEVEEIAE